MKDLKNLKIAIVHDWLVGGGAEEVVYELHKMFPEAPVYTSYATNEWRRKLDGKVITGWLQRWPFSALRKFIPVLRIWWFSSLDLSKYDVVISSAGNGEAKSVRPRKGAVHICYCHTPVHFYWRHYNSYLKHPGFGVFDPIARLGLRLLVSPLRKWDYRTAQRPDYFIANSAHIQKDIKKYYSRNSTIIHPPVRAKNYPESKKRHGFVTMGRLVPHKRIDIIIRACTSLKLPLKIIGQGPEYTKLKKMAGPNVEFLGHVDSQDVPKHLAGAKAFIFASYDDFGISPVEAMAAGTPVIAYKAGGALDYVRPGKTGQFFDKQNVKSLEVALQAFSADNYSSDDIKSYSQSFSQTEFRKKISRFIKDILQ